MTGGAVPVGHRGPCGRRSGTAAAGGEALLAKYLGGQSGSGPATPAGGRLEDGGGRRTCGPDTVDVLSAYCRRGHALQYCVRSAILPLGNSV